MSSFSWTFAEDGRVLVSGDITDEMLFGALLEALSGSVALDLSGIGMVTSSGVRRWGRFMRALGEKSTQIVFERCSVSVVQQLNQVPDFRGHAIVRSVFTPYFCVSCSSEHRIEVLIAGRAPVIEPAIRCPRCGETAEFDDVPEQYFSFLEP